MKLIIENIANVEHAEIEIKGVTVIAGQNGTGKSTISRSLFSIFSSYFDVYNKIMKDRMKSVKEALDKYLVDIEFSYNFGKDEKITRRVPPKFVTRRLSEIISQNLFDIADTSNDEFSISDIAEIIIDSIKEYNDKNSQYQILPLNEVDLNLIIEELYSIISQSNISIFNQILTDVFNDEFHKQINNIYSKKKGEISLIIKGEPIKVEIINNKIVTDELVNFRTDVVYIDDAAAIVDNTFMNGFWYEIDPKLDHNNHLVEQIQRKTNVTHTVKARVTDKLDSIFGQLTNVLVTDSVNRAEEDEDESKLNIINYSSGMKTFYLIKDLLEKGVIRENGTLILDEPEVHLHPEWQLKFAEIIILLQKEFDLHILINSHSPYLVEAIDVYSKKYGTFNNLKYYLATDSINDVTDSIDGIHNQMYIPLNLLEEISEDLDE